MGRSSVGIVRASVAAAFSLAVFSDVHAASIFQGLGDVPGGNYYSSAADISDDGKVVVGNSGPYPANGGFRWTPTGGMQSLGFARGVSNGKVFH